MLIFSLVRQVIFVFLKMRILLVKQFLGFCGFRYHWIAYGGAQPLAKLVSWKWCLQLEPVEKV